MTMSELPLWAEILISAMLFTGGLFTLIGAIGMVRFPDFYMRLHAPTKATTLGVGGVLLASIAHSVFLEGKASDLPWLH